MANEPASATVKFGAFEGKLESAHCPSCGPEAKASLVHRSSDGIGYLRCQGCGLLFASPRFTEASMLRIYETEEFRDLEPYRHWSYEAWRERRDRTYLTTALKVRLLKRFLPPGSRVLDVGCATGLLVLEANRSGLSAEGLEPSAMLSQVARDVLKVPVTTAQIEEFAPSRPFDGVVLWDVLEHLYDPVRVLSRCREMLVPGGLLFLQVPHAGGASFRLKTLLHQLRLRRSGFKHFGFPWHVYAFDRPSLTVMLGKAGLAARSIESWSHRLKEGRTDLVSRTAIPVIKKLCLSDYLVAVAQRPA